MSHNISFSVIIPTFKRPQGLENCLAAIARINYPKDSFEVIVVDDGSNVSLTPLIDKFKGHIGVNLISQSNAGPAAARNKGASHAKNRYLAFTDDDCIPSTDWLCNFNNRVLREKSNAIAGRTINVLVQNRFSSASQLLIDYLYQYYNSETLKARFFTSNNMMISADLFWEMGGFDKGFPFAAAEDRDLCDRLLSHDKKIVFAPEITVFHAHPLNLLTFCRQHLNYGRGAFRFHKNRAIRGQGHVSPEPISFYSNLLFYPIYHPSVNFKFCTPLLLVLSQIANTIGYFMELKKAEFKKNPRGWE